MKDPKERWENEEMKEEQGWEKCENEEMGKSAGMGGTTVKVENE